MKKLLFLLFVPAFALGQQSAVYNINPVVSTATVDSVSWGSPTATQLTLPSTVTGLAAGQYVFGPKIPYGTTISTVNATKDTITISAATTDTCIADGETLNFGYFSSTAYGSGDWLGLPFRIWSTTSGGVLTLSTIILVDSSDQLGNTTLSLWNAYSNDVGLDNATVAVNDEDFKELLGQVALTTAVDYGDVKFLQASPNLVVQAGGSLYGRLIAASTPTLTSITSFHLILIFKN